MSSLTQKKRTATGSVFCGESQSYCRRWDQTKEWCEGVKSASCFPERLSSNRTLGLDFKDTLNIFKERICGLVNDYCELEYFQILRENSFGFFLEEGCLHVFPVSAWVLSPRQAISGVILIGNSELSIGVHVGLDSYLSFCVSVSKVLPALQQLGQGSAPPQTPQWVFRPPSL